MLIADRAQISSRKKLANGFLLVDAVLARAGVQEYLASELGWDDLPANQMVKIYRDPEDVFAQDAMDSFAMVPLTDDHPLEDVTPDNVRELQRGHVGDAITRVGDNMKAKVLITDAATIAKVEANAKTELSNGYDTQIVRGQITAPDGTICDGKQTNIKGNHVALVDAGRCGAACRVLDHKPKAPVADKALSDCSCKEKADMAVTKKVVDGFGLVETTDEGHSVIEKLQQQLKDANAATQTAKDALSAKDGEMAVLTATHADAIKAKDDEVAAAKALSDTAALDARVAARTKLVADAKKIAGSDLETDGKSDLDIQKAAITKKLGDDAVKDKPDTFFASAFDFAALTAKDWAGDEEEEEEPDALRDALNPKTARDKAPASYEARMAARYQGAN